MQSGAQVSTSSRSNRSMALLLEGRVSSRSKAGWRPVDWCGSESRRWRCPSASPMARSLEGCQVVCSPAIRGLAHVVVVVWNQDQGEPTSWGWWMSRAMLGHWSAMMVDPSLWVAKRCCASDLVLSSHWCHQNLRMEWSRRPWGSTGRGHSGWCWCWGLAASVLGGGMSGRDPLIQLLSFVAQEDWVIRLMGGATAVEISVDTGLAGGTGHGTVGSNWLSVSRVTCRGFCWVILFLFRTADGVTVVGSSGGGASCRPAVAWALISGAHGSLT